MEHFKKTKNKDCTNMHSMQCLRITQEPHDGKKMGQSHMDNYAARSKAEALPFAVTQNWGWG